MLFRSRSVKVGPGTEADVQLGPINNRPQFDRVSELVADALSSGAVAAAGGKPMEGDGYFFEPTILAGLADGTRIVDEEQFGPALPVIPYRDIDEVVERANATNYGLSGSVWGTDVDRAVAIARRVRTGQIAVNGFGPGGAPFGGFNQSGFGRESGGIRGIRQYMEPKAMGLPA